jgi:hypothetical protein
MLELIIVGLIAFIILGGQKWFGRLVRTILQNTNQCPAGDAVPPQADELWETARDLALCSGGLLVAIQPTWDDPDEFIEAANKVIAGFRKKLKSVVVVAAGEAKTIPLTKAEVRRLAAAETGA